MTIKPGWKHVGPCLLESNCGRCRIQKVYTGPEDYEYLALVKLPSVGWKRYGKGQPDRDSAIDLCIEAVKEGVFEANPVESPVIG